MMRFLYRREMGAYLTTSLGYVLIASFAAAMGLLALYVTPRVRGGGGDWFETQVLTMESFFLAFPWVAAVLMPALGMRTWSEDLRTGTFQLLGTLPCPTRTVVVAKYLAKLTMLGLMLLATFPYVALLAASRVAGSGAIAWMEVVGGYLACLSLGAMFLALGGLFSSRTASQMVAYLQTMVVAVVLVTWGQFAGIASQEGTSFVGTLVRLISIEEQFLPLSQGLLKLETIVWYVSLSVVLVWWTAVSVEARRYAQ